MVFTCTTGSAPLAEQCPEDLDLGGGADQSATRSVTATDGGSATVTVTGINVDSGLPTFRVRGLDQDYYRGTGPDPRRRARGGPSGLVGPCSITYEEGPARVRAVVFAEDRAGQTNGFTVPFRILRNYLEAPYRRAPGFLVCAGRSYTLVSVSASRRRPCLVEPVSSSAEPSRPGPLLKRAGTLAGSGPDEGVLLHRYSLRVTMPDDMTEQRLEPDRSPSEEGPRAT